MFSSNIRIKTGINSHAPVFSLLVSVVSWHLNANTLGSGTNFGEFVANSLAKVLRLKLESLESD